MISIMLMSPEMLWIFIKEHLLNRVSWVYLNYRHSAIVLVAVYLSKEKILTINIEAQYYNLQTNFLL